MEWRPVLSGLVGAILTTLIGRALSRRKPRVDPVSRRIIVSYGVAVQAIGVVGTLFFAFLTTLAVWKHPDDYYAQFLMGGLCVLFGGYTFLEFFGVRIEFDSETVRRFAPWHRPRVASWDQIERITYSPGAEWHVLHTSSGKIRVSDWMAGSRELVEYARQRLEEARQAGQNRQ